MMMNRRAVIGSASLAALGVGAFGINALAAPRRKFEVAYSDAEWLKRLGPQRFGVLRQAHTERPFSSPLDKEKRAGIFVCAGCGLPLYSSKTKFASHTGWPSFWAPLRSAWETKTDFAIGIPRTEVHCRRCGGHLGHVFDDGPKPTGKRYCMNGLAMKFTPGRA